MCVSLYIHVYLYVCVGSIFNATSKKSNDYVVMYYQYCYREKSLGLWSQIKLNSIESALYFLHNFFISLILNCVTCKFNAYKKEYQCKVNETI